MFGIPPVSADKSAARGVDSETAFQLFFDGPLKTVDIACDSIARLPSERVCATTEASLLLVSILVSPFPFSFLRLSAVHLTVHGL